MNRFLVRHNGSIVGSARGKLQLSGRYTYTVWDLNGTIVAECECYSLAELLQDSSAVLRNK